MLLVSPERLNNPDFRDEVLPQLAATAGLLVVDEAHCISDWGHDFRPDYRRIRTLLADLPPGIPVLATTATANARVTADVAEQLGADAGDGPTRWCCAARSTGSPCACGVVRLPTAGAAAGLAGRPPRRAARAPGIIYCLTVAATQEVADYLRERGHAVAAVLRADRDRRAAGRPRRTCWPTGSRRWSPPARSGMGFDKPTSASSSTSARRRRRSPTTSRSAAPAAAVERAEVLLLPGARGPRHLGLLRLARLPARGAGAPARSTCWPAATAAVHAGAGDAGRPARARLETMLKVLDVDGAVAAGPGRLDRHRAAVGLRRRALRAGSPRPARGGAAGHARLPRRPPSAGWSSCATSSTTRTARAVRPLRQLRRRAGSTRDVSGGRAEAARERLGRPGRGGRAAHDVADRAGRPRRDLQGPDPAGEQARAGRALGRLSDIGWGARCASCSCARRRADGRSPRRRGAAQGERRSAGAEGGAGRLRAGARGLGMGRAPGRRGRHGLAHPPPPARPPRPADRGDRQAAAARHPRAARAAARSCTPTRPSGSRPCGARRRAAVRRCRRARCCSSTT